MTGALRCPDCLIDWPLGTKRCGQCLAEDLDHFRNAEPMSAEQAKRITRRAEFERYYEERERKRERRGDLTPEQLGALEAREIAVLNRDLGIWPT